MDRKTGEAAKSQALGDLTKGIGNVRYPTAQLLRSKALAGYQRDFAAALLTGPEYSVQEAKAILDKFFKGGGR